MMTESMHLGATQRRNPGQKRADSFGVLIKRCNYQPITDRGRFEFHITDTANIFDDTLEKASTLVSVIISYAIVCQRFRGYYPYIYNEISTYGNQYYDCKQYFQYFVKYLQKL